MYKVELLSITCTHVGGGSGDDNVVIIAQTDAGLPKIPMRQGHDMDNGDTWDLTNGNTQPGPTYYYRDTATFCLYDQDGAFNQWDAADFLGANWCGKDTSVTTLTMNGAANDARYSMDVKVTRLNVKDLIEADIEGLIEANAHEVSAELLITSPPCFQVGRFKNIGIIENITCLNTAAPSSNDNVVFKALVDGATTPTCKYPPVNAFEMDDDDDNTLVPGIAIKFDSTVSVQVFAANGEPDEVVGTLTWDASDFTSSDPVPKSFNNKYGAGKVSYSATMSRFHSSTMPKD